MKTPARVLTAFGLIAFMVACGGDKKMSPGNAGDRTTPVATSTGKTTQFQSSRKAYTVSYPSDWTLKEDFMSVGGISSDAFTLPERKSDFSPNVNILCEPVSPATSSDQYLKDNLKTYETQKMEAKVVRKIATGAGEGTLITVTSAFGGRQLDIAQILLVSSRCGWVMTLTTLQGDRDNYLTTFLTMASSFKTR